MAETVRYINSQGGTLTLSASPSRYERGDGLDTWHVTPVWDALISDEDDFAGYALGKTEWSLKFHVEGTSYADARGTAAAWRKEFMNDVSRDAQGSFVIVHNGGTYTIDAAHATSEISGPDSNYIGITLKFESKSPFWQYLPQQSTVSAFNGTAIVSVVWNNTGDYKTWPIHHITGVVNTPRITDVGTGHYIEIGTVTANANDQIYVWTDSPLIRYYQNGTGAGVKTSGSNWTGYGGTASKFDALQVGAGAARLTAAAGSAAYELLYDIRKAGIG